MLTGEQPVELGKDRPPQMRLIASPRSLACLLVATLAACGSTPPSAPPAAPAPTANTTSMPAIKIGVALGGGAAKGFAHIGVIKMLEANGFAPAVVAGTSAGSVVGALYASGMDAFALQEKAVALDEGKIRDLQFSTGGLVQGQKLEDYVNEQVRRKPLEQLAKPFVAVATRLEDGERTVFARGNTGQAVRASSSVPGVFQPVTIGKYHFVDGGIVSPVPVDAARQLGADVVVAVAVVWATVGCGPGGLLPHAVRVAASSNASGRGKTGRRMPRDRAVIGAPSIAAVGNTSFQQRFMLCHRPAGI